MAPSETTAWLAAILILLHAVTAVSLIFPREIFYTDLHSANPLSFKKRSAFLLLLLMFGSSLLSLVLNKLTITLEWACVLTVAGSVLCWFTHSKMAPGLKQCKVRFTRRIDLLAILSIVAFTLLTTTYQWETTPPGIVNDSAAYAISGRTLWTGGGSPIAMSSGAMPRLLDTLEGLITLSISDPRLRTMVYPWIASCLAAVAMYRIGLLAGSPLQAWMLAILLVSLPGYQYYSRVSLGTALFLGATAGGYYLIRGIQTGSYAAVTLAGAWLGVMQWGYWGARIMLPSALIGALFLLLRWRRKGLALSSLLIGVIALCLIPLVLIAASAPSDWTSLLTLRRYSLNDSLFLSGHRDRLEVLQATLRMFFDPSGSEFGVFTIPGAAIIPEPLGSLAAIGLGVCLMQPFKARSWIILAMFGASLLGSILSNSAPNPHRSMLALLPLSWLVVIPLWIVLDFTKGLKSPRHSGMGIFGAFLLVGLGVRASLLFFHTTMWADPRTAFVQDAHFYERSKLTQMHTAIDRRHFHGYATPTDDIITGTTIPVFDYDSWLPSLQRPTSTGIFGVEIGFLNFIKTILPEGAIQTSGIATVGHQPWALTSSSLLISPKSLKDSWANSHRVEGVFLSESSGLLQATQRQISLEPENVASGMTRVVIERSSRTTRESSPLPIQLRLSDPMGSRDLDLTTSNFLEIPFYGWKQTLEYVGCSNATQRVRHVPAIYFRGIREPLGETGGCRRRLTYTAVANITIDSAQFTLEADRADALLQVWSSNELLAKGSGRTNFSLSKLTNSTFSPIKIEMTDQVGPGNLALLVESPGSPNFVPPYSWFVPPHGFNEVHIKIQ